MNYYDAYIIPGGGPNPEGLNLAPKHGYIQPNPRFGEHIPANVVTTDAGDIITTDGGDPVVLG